jgi:hypothetical protein
MIQAGRDDMNRFPGPEISDENPRPDPTVSDHGKRVDA